MLRDLEILAAQYTRSRGTLFQALVGLTYIQRVELLPERDWSINDTLTHIAGNETLMTGVLQSIAKATPNPLPPDFDNEKFNQENVAAGRKKTDDQLKADLDASHAYLWDVLERIKPDELERRGHHPAAGETNVKEFFLAMYAHHEVHTRDVIEQGRRFRQAQQVE